MTSKDDETLATASGPSLASPAVVPGPSQPAVAPPTAEASSSTDPSASMSAPAVAAVADAAGTLSKKAIKRAAKFAAFEANKASRRAHDKEKKQARKLAVQEQIAAGDTELFELEQAKAAKAREKSNLQRRFEWQVDPSTGHKAPKDESGWFQARCVVDLAFDDLMLEKEIKSMASQIGFLWNIQRTAAKPFRSLLFTHLDKRLGDNLRTTIFDKSVERFKTTEWWDGKDLDGLWKTAEGPASPVSAPAPPSEKRMRNAKQDATSPLPTKLSEHELATIRALPSTSSRENVIYLTADSENTVDALEEGVTYVIGGLVDKNRHKSLCLNKAHDLGIRTARLPIGQYLADMPTRKVLTVNQVYEILTAWIETRSWETAFKRVVPQRKMTEGGHKAAKRQKVSHDDDGGGAAGASKGETSAAAAAATGMAAAVAAPDEAEDDEEAAMNL